MTHEEVTTIALLLCFINLQGLFITIALNRIGSQIRDKK